MGACRFDGSCASGTVPWASGLVGVHCLAPAGLVVSSQSYLNRLSRNPLSHLVGSLVHAPSSPLVIASAPVPLPELFFQPRSCCSTGAASGSGPMYLGSTAPWVFPSGWRLMVSANFFSHFIAIR